jgi:hypothetical protein
MFFYEYLTKRVVQLTPPKPTNSFTTTPHSDGIGNKAQ